jgi:hypothetical protein
MSIVGFIHGSDATTSSMAVEERQRSPFHRSTMQHFHTVWVQISTVDSTNPTSRVDPLLHFLKLLVSFFPFSFSMLGGTPSDYSTIAISIARTVMMEDGRKHHPNDDDRGVVYCSRSGTNPVMFVARSSVH